MDNSDGKINKPLLKIALLFILRSALADHTLFVIRQSSFCVRYSLLITGHSLHLHHQDLPVTHFPPTPRAMLSAPCSFALTPET
jgi:hypothetical protein